jgi:hypothetical protein
VSDDPVDLIVYLWPDWSVTLNHFAVVVESSVYGPELSHAPGVVGAERVIGHEHELPTVHTPTWVTDTVRPAIVSVALREFPELELAVTVTVPDPVPLVGLQVSHDALEVAVQGQEVADAVTVTDCGGGTSMVANASDVGETVKVHTPSTSCHCRPNEPVDPELYSTTLR